MTRWSAFVPPQLAALSDVVPQGEQWLFEAKYDGYRLQAHREGPAVRLLTRRGLDWTARFPGIAAAVSGLRISSAILDGEAIATDADGRTSFQALQQRLDGHIDTGISFVAFDLLVLDGHDLRELPLHERREHLTRVLKRQTGRHRVRLSEELPGPARLLLEAARRLDMEGIIAKRRAAPYRSGRGRDWMKVKCSRRQEFVVIGYTPPQGSRTSIGALLLGYFSSDGDLQFAGRVGTGMSDDTLVDLLRRFAKLRRAVSPLDVTPAGLPKGVQWVAPTLVVEIAFTEWTEDGHLRHPSFQGVREDKPARQVRREMAVSTSSSVAQASHAEGRVVIAGVSITHPDRIIYPETGLTKRHVAQHFADVAPQMLPHLVGRPLSLVRCPDGTAGECFFQKHWPGKPPTVLDTVSIRQSDGVRPYIVVRDVAGLVTLAQWGVLEIHPWGARADDPERPDRITFDLDPGEGSPWSAMQEAARRLRTVLKSVGLESWLKTSGGKGLHVVVPVQRRVSWDGVSAFARAVAEYLAEEHPDDYVARARKSERQGRIFIDWLRNSRGATSVAPWSPRARPRAGVSVPVTWSALSKLTAGDQYTIAEWPRRARDPWQPMLKSRQGLSGHVAKALAGLAD